LRKYFEGVLDEPASQAAYTWNVVYMGVNLVAVVGAVKFNRGMVGLELHDELPMPALQRFPHMYEPQPFVVAERWIK
jgi:hypothetical protein